MPTISITTTVTQANRIQSALGTEKGLTDPFSSPPNEPRDATGAEVKAWLIEQIKALVKRAEGNDAFDAAQAAAKAAETPLGDIT